MWYKGLRSNDPVENVRQLFSRTEWELDSYAQWEVDHYADVLQELPGRFVSALFNLKADQNTTVEFQIENIGRIRCFANARRVTHSVMEIVQAMYPTLRTKRFGYDVELDYFNTLTRYKSNYEEEDYFKRLSNPNGLGGFRTEDTKSTFHWCCRDSSTAQMVMFWLRENCYGTDPATLSYITRHSFTFRANLAWVEQRAADRQFLEGIGLERVLAFAMGGHKRLGERSYIRNFNADVLQSIGKLLIKHL